jgi:hypothetical protein
MARITNEAYASSLGDHALSCGTGGVQCGGGGEWVNSKGRKISVRGLGVKGGGGGDLHDQCPFPAHHLWVGVRAI